MNSIGIGANALEAERDAPGPLARAAASHPRLVLAAAIVIAACLGQLTALAKFQAVWSTGAFFDTDDAMRAVQVRDLAAGQGWFDMTAYRLDPPDGVFMHWSRVVDVPLLFLLKAFGTVADPVTAERLARLAFPLLLTFALFALLVSLCEHLLGRVARYPALAAAFLSGPATGQFEPGRIDHHAPQIVLLVLVVWALCRAILADRAHVAAVGGAAVALSVAISVENIPFLAALSAALGLVWVLEGRRVSSVLAWFAVGIACALPVIYAATIAPSRWSLVVPDALSLAQGTAMMAGASLLLMLAALSRGLPDDARIRVVVAGACAAPVGALLIHFFPMLAENPFAHLDPLVRALWLDGVEEAQPLARKFAADPLWTAGVVAPALIGLAGAVWCSLRSSRPHNRAWMLVAITTAGGFVASTMMIRTLSPVLALGVPGALALAIAIRDRLSMSYGSLRGPLGTLVLILSLSSVGWAAACNQIRRLDAPVLSANASRGPAAGARADFSVCTKPDAFAQLAQLPPGLVLAEPDLGAYLLAHTPHTVLAGAYHRNERGMRDAILALLATPGDARRRVTDTRASYVVYCRGAIDPQYIEASPSGLAASLSKQQPPSWLRHLVAENAPLDIYAVESAP